MIRDDLALQVVTLSDIILYWCHINFVLTVADFLNSTGGYPVKLSLANICHTVNLLTSGKAGTAVQVSKALQPITNQPVTTQMVHRHLRRTGMKAVVKKKKAPSVTET